MAEERPVILTICPYSEEFLVTAISLYYEGHPPPLMGKDPSPIIYHSSRINASNVYNPLCGRSEADSVQDAAGKARG